MQTLYAALAPPPELMHHNSNYGLTLPADTFRPHKSEQMEFQDDCKAFWSLAAAAVRLRFVRCLVYKLETWKVVRQ